MIKSIESLVEDCGYSIKENGLIVEKIDILEEIHLTIMNAKEKESIFAMLCIKEEKRKRRKGHHNELEDCKSGESVLQCWWEFLIESEKNAYWAFKRDEKIYILIKGINLSEDIYNAVEQVHDKLKMCKCSNKNKCCSQAVFGCAIYPFDGETEFTLVSNAEMAVQHAVEKRSENVEYYNKVSLSELNQKYKILTSMDRALERNEFVLYYQPQVDVRSGEIVGLEALIRWLHPELGLLNPHKFIPIMEESKRIICIGEWALRTACLQNQKWKKEGIKTVPIAVNIPATQFDDSNIVGKIKKILKETGVTAGNLEIEITESYPISNYEKASKVMLKLKKLGVSITLDDFGMKYSSINVLSKIPIDTIKIDKEYVQALNRDAQSVTILQSILKIAKVLNLNVIAEGVETIDQIEALIREDCYTMQGYYFFEPIPDKEVELLLKINKYLEPIAIKRSNKGYRYLLSAIQLGIADLELLNNLYKIYTIIGEKEHTTPRNVERVIRYSLSKLQTTNKKFIKKAVYFLVQK